MAQAEKKKVMRKSVAPYYGVAVTCLAYAWLLPLYRLSDVLLMGAAACGVAALLRAMCRDPEETRPRRRVGGERE